MIERGIKKHPVGIPESKERVNQAPQLIFQEGLSCYSIKNDSGISELLDNFRKTIK